MRRTQIKICGIKQPEMAVAAAQAGANFIGIVLAPTSKRLVSHEMAAKIAASARQAGAEPVAVFTESTAEEIIALCQQADIHYVQLHSETARQQRVLLPQTLHVIYVCSVTSNGKINPQQLRESENLSPTRDYLLFDGENWGSGQVFDWENFSYQGSMSWFLSGGLNPRNVQHAMDSLHPWGVDVSSGVENNQGEKELRLIKDFIDGCRLDCSGRSPG